MATLSITAPASRAVPGSDPAAPDFARYFWPKSATKAPGQKLRNRDFKNAETTQQGLPPAANSQSANVVSDLTPRDWNALKLPHGDGEFGMFGARSFVLAASCAAACAISASLPSAAPAQTIDLSLNVFYATPSNPLSGGTWELVAKTNGLPAAGNYGISGIEAKLKNIAAAVDRTPWGFVNEFDFAGFGVFQDVPSGTTRTLIAGQIPAFIINPGDTQGAFYGVGQLTNGSPDFPGKLAGTNTFGPAIPSFESPQGIPWATGDSLGNAAWNTASRMASGTFATGVTPEFVAGSSGNVFTTLGTSTVFGDSGPATINTFVRTNFMAGGADYNHNGIVDAADYIIWRNSNGQTVTPGTLGDGDGNGIVNQLDYNLWRSRFGLPSGAGSGSGGGGNLSTGAVPEPLSAVLLLSAILVFGFHRNGLRLGESRLQPVLVPARASGRLLAAVARSEK